MCCSVGTLRAFGSDSTYCSLSIWNITAEVAIKCIQLIARLISLLPEAYVTINYNNLCQISDELIDWSLLIFALLIELADISIKLILFVI